MKFDRIQGVLFLEINSDCLITFKDEWVEKLRSLPYDQFGEFIRSTIYPAFNDKEKKIWNKVTISNIDLQAAIQAFAS